MFDLLTTAELERTIRELTAERDATHAKMIREDGTPGVPPLSVEWMVLGGHYDEVADLIDAAYTELIRREAEGWDVAKPATQPRITDA